MAQPYEMQNMYGVSVSRGPSKEKLKIVNCVLKRNSGRSQLLSPMGGLNHPEELTHALSAVLQFQL